MNFVYLCNLRLLCTLMCKIVLTIDFICVDEI